MFHEVFCVYDSKSCLYGFPFYQATVEAGKRSFGQMAYSPDNLMNVYPGDFTLFHVGRYDDNTGRVEMFPSHVNLGMASEYVASLDRIRGAIREANDIQRRVRNGDATEPTPSVSVDPTPGLSQQHDEGDY